MIDFKNVKRVYSGRPGCMCGCRGTYNTSALSIKRAVNKLNKRIDWSNSLAVQSHMDDKCAWFESETYTKVVYFS